jgi:hypothetical protein
MQGENTNGKLAEGETRGKMMRDDESDAGCWMMLEEDDGGCWMMLEDAGGCWRKQADEPAEAMDITAPLVPQRMNGDGFACSWRQGLVWPWMLSPPHTSPRRPTTRRGMQTSRPGR